MARSEVGLTATFKSAVSLTIPTNTGHPQAIQVNQY